MKQYARGRWAVKCGVTLGIAASLQAGVCWASETDESLIEKEIQSRSESVTLAQELLLQGDEAYKKHDFAAAVDAYKKAFELIPRAGLTHEIKAAAADRYAQAAVENAKVLIRTGQYDKARRELLAASSPDVAPGHAGVKKMLAKLDDPIRTSTTLTLEHVNNIESVAQNLRKAESYYMQGQYKEALAMYKEVIKIDPYNKAARRGMEKTQNEMHQYYRAAKDERRSAALADVAAAWSNKVGSRDEQFKVVQANGESELVTQVQDLNKRKLEHIIVPIVDMQDISFNDALRMIRIWSRELDTFELDESKKGLNFVTRFGDEMAGFLPKIEKRRINIQLKNVPLATVLDYVTQATGTYWRAEPYAIVIRPLGAQTAEMQTRKFRVPLGFLDNATVSEDDKNIFDDTGSALKGKQTAVDYFKSLGIDFPKGAGAFYNSQNNTVRVTNTPSALDSIEQLIRAQTMKEKVVVKIQVTFLEVNQTILNELGYDWLLDPARFKGGVYVGGGTRGNGSLVPPISAAGPAAVFNGAPITSGNRSGDSMFSGDAIDSRLGGLNASIGSATIEAARAPGVVQLTGGNGDALVQAILRGVAQKGGKSRVIKNTLITAPGQRASLFSGEEIFIAEEYEPAEIPTTVQAGGGVSPVTPSTPTSFVQTKTGFTLELEPTVSDDKNYIDFTLNPQMRLLEGFVNYGSPILSPSVDPITGLIVSNVVTPNQILMPVFNTLRANTNVTVQDGHTIIIGGLMQSRIETVHDKVPVLGSMPLVGRYFRSDGVKSTKKAILIFVKAELMDPTGTPWRQR